MIGFRLKLEIIILILVSLLFCLIYLAANVLKGNETILLVDGIVNLYFFTPKGSPFDKFFEYITFFGGHWFLVPVVVIASVFLIYKKNYFEFAVFLIGSVFNAQTIHILKHYVLKIRPITDTYIVETSPAFPSGHAGNSSYIYIFLLFIILKTSNRLPQKTVIASTVIFVALIAFSRIYLNLHWFSDVIGGFLVAGFYFSLSYLVYTIYNDFIKSSKPDTIS